MRKLFLDLTGPKNDMWVWQLVDDNERVISRSKGSFLYYLDVLADARASGCKEQPSFRPVVHETESKEARAKLMRTAAELLNEK